MTATAFDDPALRAAMQAYLDAARRLDEAGATADPRRFIDLAEDKTVAAMLLQRRLVEQGWTAPPGGAPRSAAPQGGSAPEVASA